MIPKNIHFVYGLKADFGGKPFSFVHWAAVKSALALNPGYKCYFWFSHLPDTHYFDDVKSQLELRQIEAPSEIFGRQLVHVAHKADLIRLMVLLEYGGFYLDMDTITTKSFDSLRDNKFIMAIEKCNGQVIGLCNAIMGAIPQAAFTYKWIDKFAGFRSQGHDEHWNEMAVRIPAQLAQENPNDITILDQKFFFYPDWSPEGLEEMFVKTREFPQAFAHHLWETVSWGALSSINENNVSKIKNSYTDLVCKILKYELDLLKSRRMSWVDRELNGKNATLNLGSGSKFESQLINCDMYPESGADLIFNLTDRGWPIPSNSVKHIRLFHVLEHLPGDLEAFFQELYRVSTDQATVEVRVPHPRHDWFYTDPTHVRAWLPESFTYLDKKISLARYFGKDSKTPLALYWDIDFQVIKTDLIVDQSMAHGIPSSFIGSTNIGALLPYINNIVCEIIVILKVRKSN